MSGKVNAKTIETSEAEAAVSAMEVVRSDMTKSTKIRKLFAMTGDRSTVANLLGIRYQHVRNVLVTPIKTEAEVQADAQEVIDEVADAQENELTEVSEEVVSES